MALSHPIPPANQANEDAVLPAKLQQMPTYMRSLLKVKVPVLVTLAETKKAIGQITELVPGSIIHFDKSCEETLTLQVGETTVARGEAVKVGDKFGLRITSMVMPDERFFRVQRDRHNADS
jgi:flagellar motor switch/type III secretory pathway protein FliN